MRKIFILSLVLLLLSCRASSSQEVRRPAVAGAFYPLDKQRLKEKIRGFLDSAEKINIDGTVIAIVVPHAGYDYSGEVAAYSYKQLEGRMINTAVIICNSHTGYFSGIAIDAADAWQTPLGLVNIDNDLADRLVNAHEEIKYNSELHRRDHTIEVQVPFLQALLKENFKIVPILFGNTYDDTYKELAQLLSENLGKDDIVIVSTDMSHYPGYEDANMIDRETLQIIKERDIPRLEDHIRKVKGQDIKGEETLCCGIDGVKTIMELSKILDGVRIEVLHYANSGDVDIGDKARVVGYGSIIIYIPGDPEEKGEKIMEGGYLNKEEKKKLIEIARASIVEAVTGKKGFGPNSTEERLKENCGAFVTIKKHGELRGCIGYIMAKKPLHETVKDVARSAAINDFRFSPVSEEELDKITLEISVLTPLRRVKTIDEITVGRHGLYMKRGLNSGLLLPQVATEYGWDKETFLEHTAMKAGLAAGAWKDKSTEIYLFSAEVVTESDIQ
jgi:AmmeMemoRadiSam system protein B/AmmeMemoRadiSam system protein A